MFIHLYNNRFLFGKKHFLLWYLCSRVDQQGKREINVKHLSNVANLRTYHVHNIFHPPDPLDVARSVLPQCHQETGALCPNGHPSPIMTPILYH